MPFVLCRDANGNEFEVSQITIDRFPGDYKPVKKPKTTSRRPAVDAPVKATKSGGSNLEGES